MPARRLASALLLALALAGPGCTHQQLQRTTIHTASTVTSLQYQQILDNLAMFACDPAALPWQLKLSGGVVQVTDQGTGQVAGDFSNGNPSHWLPLLAAQRTVVAQWQVNPAVDPDELELLRLAYRKALNPLDADGAIRRDAYKEVGELSATYGVLLQESVLDTLIDMRRKEVGSDADKQAELKKKREDMHGLFRELREWGARTEGGKELDRRIAQILLLTGEIAELPFVALPRQMRNQGNPADVQAAQDKIKALLDMVANEPGEPNPFNEPWLAWGHKLDVPHGACLVGRFCDCYAWVLPDKKDVLRQFTIAVLTFAPVQAQNGASPLVAFSPGF